MESIRLIDAKWREKPKNRHITISRLLFVKLLEIPGYDHIYILYLICIVSQKKLPMQSRVPFSQCVWASHWEGIKWKFMKCVNSNRQVFPICICSPLTVLEPGQKSYYFVSLALTAWILITIYHLSQSTQFLVECNS